MGVGGGGWWVRPKLGGPGLTEMLGVMSASCRDANCDNLKFLHIAHILNNLTM